MVLAVPVPDLRFTVPPVSLLCMIAERPIGTGPLLSKMSGGLMGVIRP
jgi:hypothetical protein